MENYITYRQSFIDLYLSLEESVDDIKIKDIHNKVDNNIKECEDEYMKTPDLINYFDLIEGKCYYVYSGLSHISFRVVKKTESLYKGIPYYEVKYIKHSCFGGPINIPDSECEIIRPFTVSMIFLNFKSIDE